MITHHSEFRNVAFVGHPSAGKTTLVDALAHSSGLVDRKGSVHDRTSLCDTEPEEREKGHTLQLAVVDAPLGGRTWNWIDTPGYPDFEADARAAMFASDLVVGVVSATSGVTHNLRRKMSTAAALGRPRALLVTHVDAANVDFDGLVDELREAIGPVCVPVLLPVVEEGRLVGVERTMTRADVHWRKRLMDRVMDACEDEGVVERYLETEDLSEEELREHYPTAIANGALIPIMVANPEDGVGVGEVLAFLDRAAPAADQHAGFHCGTDVIDCDPEGELLGTVFAVHADPHVGKLIFVRILSGTLGDHDHVQGLGAGAKDEKVGGLFRLVGGSKREPVQSLPAGSIGCLAKVESLFIGDTFGHPGADLRPIDFAQMPVPMVSLAVRPKSRADEQKIGAALHKLESEDPTLRVEVDPVTHELVVSGMSDLHLQIMEQRLKRRFGVEIETSLPRIAYRETIRKPAEGHYRHKKQSGGRGQFGECHLRVRPAEEGAGIVFLDSVVGGAIPRNLIPAVEKGVREVCGQGILTHSRVVDVEIELYDGKFHAVDSDEASFRAAGARAFRAAFEIADPVLLEPVMEVELRIPTEYAGAIFSDLTSHRRAHVLEQNAEAGGALTVIRAHAPQVTMQAYHRELKSQTAGAGSWTMRFDHYAPMPPAEQRRVVAEAARAAHGE